jgi:hypothetical protein
MRLLEALHTLAEVARAIAPTYIPAEMISSVLENLLQEPGWNYKQMTNIEADDAMKAILSNMAVIGDEFFRNPMAPCAMPQSQLSMSNLDRNATFPLTSNSGTDILARVDEANYSFDFRDNLNFGMDGIVTNLPQRRPSEPDGMIDANFMPAST